MPVQLGDVLRVVCKLSHGLDDVQNVYHAKVFGTAAPTDSQAYGAVASVLDAAYAVIDGPMSTNVSFDSISVYNLTQDYFIGEAGWPTVTDGNGVGGDLPQQCAPLILFPTDVLKSVGKKYLPPFAEEVLDTDGTIASGLLAAMATFAATILDGFTGVNYTVEFGNYRVDTAQFIPWVSAIVRDFFATQRRRYKGKGS